MNNEYDDEEAGNSRSNYKKSGLKKLDKTATFGIENQNKTMIVEETTTTTTTGKQRDLRPHPDDETCCAKGCNIF
jgi:hypothetical protein